MNSLRTRILQHISTLPEGAVLSSKGFLHLGNRAAVDQSLSRLARSGQLMRVCQGVYVSPVETRFGTRPPEMEKTIAALSRLWGETIVPSGGSMANALGFITQTPVKPVYLTSGPNRRLKFGEMTVELRHAPRWQLVSPNRKAGDVVRALAWMGPEEAEHCLGEVSSRLTREDIDELAEARAIVPEWIAGPVSEMISVE